MDGRLGDAVPESVWIVEDEPAAAELVLDICRAANVRPRLFDAAQPLLNALRESPTPSAIVLDWRLRNELSAGLFLATRHRFPALPVIYWTASQLHTLPTAIRHDPMTRVVEKPAGIGEFEAALSWALSTPALSGIALQADVDGLRTDAQPA